jgi:hypothetical protein
VPDIRNSFVRHAEIDLLLTVEIIGGPRTDYPIQDGESNITIRPGVLLLDQGKEVEDDGKEE